MNGLLRRREHTVATELEKKTVVLKRNSTGRLNRETCDYMLLSISIIFFNILGKGFPCISQ